MNVVLVYRGRYHIREALDLETLASVLREGGHHVQLVYDPDTFGITDNVFQVRRLARWLNSDERTVARILAAEPDAIIFGVLSSTYAWCQRVARVVKEQTAAPLVFTGLHPTLVPEHVMRDSVADYTVSGEAEGVINPLLDRFDAPDRLGEVGNLWYRKNGQVVSTFRAELVDLDALPLPDKELFAPFVAHRYSYCAMVSRGCPYQCSFCEETCSSKLYGGRYFRRKHVETVMRELVAAKRRYRFREVIFKDSYLSGNQPWLRELAQRYGEEIGVPFKCFCTIHGFDEETAELLKRAGCYSIEFGLQTWNDRLRREVLNRKEASDEAFRAFALCDKFRLRYDVDHMFNLPDESDQDHMLGALCYRQLRFLGRVKVHYLVYHPTADILELAILRGDLPAEARQQIAAGQESDFYDQARSDKTTQERISGYAALYKILPLLPAKMVRWLADARRVRYLRRIPSPVMAALQGMNAVRCGDLRFAAYLRFYPTKIFHTLIGSTPRTNAPERAS